MYARTAANTYANVGVQTGAMSASPHRLIVMLFDGARAAIARARFHLEAGKIADKGMAISKAIEIIDSGLRASLDHGASAELAANLDALYEYMTRQLMLGNLHNDDDRLLEVDKLLADLASAWGQIDPAAEPEQQPLRAQEAVSVGV